MPARTYSTSPEDRPALTAELDERKVLVVGLCAAWCRACGEFRQTFDAIAAATPDKTFVWLDIEDDHAVVGDIDVADFPTLAIYDGSRPIHYGVTLPQRGVVTRLVASMSTDSGSIVADDAVVALPSSLADLARN